jgi:hypothetical protein
VDTTKSSAHGRRTEHPEVLAGDPFPHAGAQRGEDRSCTCFGGYVTITVEEGGEERDEAVPWVFG